MTIQNSDQYFATLPREEIAQALHDKLTDFYDHVQQEGFVQLWRDGYRAYYGRESSGEHTSARVSSRGVRGQLSKVKVNHVGNLGKHLLTLTTAERPALQAMAVNTDVKSQSQATTGTNLIDYYMTEKRLEDSLRDAVEGAIIAGGAWLGCTWDATAGDEYMPDPVTKQIVRQGDITYTNFTVLDVAFDAQTRSNRRDWIITRSFVNKWDLAAKYPELAEQILDADIEDKLLARLDIRSRLQEESDEIPVFEFYHRKTDAVPDGRYVKFLDETTVLQYGAIPYRELPAFFITPGRLHGQPFGATPLHDLLGLQAMLDTLYSCIYTNQKSFGIQNLMAPKGHGFSTKQLGGGLNFIEFNEGKEPKALNLTQTPPEIFNFVQLIEKQMETLSGINSVVRGQPDKNLQSGAALALIQTQAQQFATGLQASYQRLLEQIGTATINILRDFAKSPRNALIAGIASRGSSIEQL